MTDRIRETDGAVAAAVRAMYASYPDSARFDEHLHPEITIWETDHPGPLIGLPELRSGRSAPPADAVPELSVHDLLVDRWGEQAAVARYVLRAALTDGDVVSYRVTDVWDFGADRWRIVHHHAEQQ